MTSSISSAIPVARDSTNSLAQGTSYLWAYTLVPNAEPIVSEAVETGKLT
jgi:hypothetical protein